MKMPSANSRCKRTRSISGPPSFPISGGATLQQTANFRAVRQRSLSGEPRELWHSRVFRGQRRLFRKGFEAADAVRMRVPRGDHSRAELLFVGRPPPGAWSAGSRSRSDEDLKDAKLAPLKIIRTSTSGSEAPYFIDMVKDHLLDKYSETELLSENFRVYTTLDPALQRAAA